MVQKTRPNNPPGGFGVPKGKARGGAPPSSPPPPPGPPQVTAWGFKVTKFAVSWWSPVCQNMIMPSPETEFYGVKQHSGVARWCRPAPGRLGFALGALSGQPWARS